MHRTVCRVDSIRSFVVSTCSIVVSTHSIVVRFVRLFISIVRVASTTFCGISAQKHSVVLVCRVFVVVIVCLLK